MKEINNYELMYDTDFEGEVLFKSDAFFNSEVIGRIDLKTLKKWVKQMDNLIKSDFKDGND
jgi:hypothetical protein